ncbi:hypothetical protein J31TS4_20810 [Paenibacillus sp. J31TS4]|uniref:cupredoxin domain-containing protein n=1 Tax=Paenibacillus sp. J31TS4 TaxID=2807195 RepID=UPI001B0ABA7C|nr:cupredoxin domain-containing protein [Paenibacillus sp. J31TS4]GIP38801.1 hypothetical protein J31TS4_20810 [Paenibacillus sp. J31TS4]
MKKTVTIALSAVLMLALAACGGQSKDASQAPDPNAKELKLVASNYQFDKQEYVVKKGEPLQLVLDDKNGTHGVEIKGTNVKLSSKSKTASYTPDKAGTYDIICNVPCGVGHANMKAKLIVE